MHCALLEILVDTPWSVLSVWPSRTKLGFASCHLGLARAWGTRAIHTSEYQSPLSCLSEILNPVHHSPLEAVARDARSCLRMRGAFYSLLRPGQGGKGICSNNAPACLFPSPKVDNVEYKTTVPLIFGAFRMKPKAISIFYRFPNLWL